MSGVVRRYRRSLAIVAFAAAGQLVAGSAPAQPGSPAVTPAESAATVRDRLAAAGLSGSIGLQYFSSNHDIDDREHFPGANLVLKQRLALTDGVRWIAEARVLAQQIGHEDEDASHW